MKNSNIHRSQAGIFFSELDLIENIQAYWGWGSPVKNIPVSFWNSNSAHCCHGGDRLNVTKSYFSRDTRFKSLFFI